MNNTLNYGPAVLLSLALLPISPGLAAPTPTLQVDSLPPELAVAAPEVERKVWHKRPIAISLPVNRERLVTFNIPIRILEMPGDLDETALRTQIVADTQAGTIYWTALKPFDSRRIQLQDIGSGNIVLLDVMASPSGPDTRIDITVPGAVSGGAEQTRATDPQPAAAAREPDPVSLTRLAAQHLYAPERLLQVPDGVYRSPVRQTPTDRLFHGGQIEATPLIAWRAGMLTVTAVKLKNRSAADVILDPRTLRGPWQTATFQHNLLKPQGQLRDTTAAYLISTGSFDEVLHGHQ